MYLSGVLALLLREVGLRVLADCGIATFSTAVWHVIVKHIQTQIAIQEAMDQTLCSHKLDLGATVEALQKWKLQHCWINDKWHVCLHFI